MSPRRDRPAPLAARAPRSPLWAMVLKEAMQVRRDRRTLAMMVVLPILLLVVFGYAASFDVTSVPTVLAGPQAALAARLLPPAFHVEQVAEGEGSAWAAAQLRDGHAAVAVVATAAGLRVLVDGSQLFTARYAEQVAAAASVRTGRTIPVEVLFNPGLATSAVMVPGLAGVILVFVGTVVTSLGVVRERQSGTLEQLAVTPIRPADLFLGKIAPYFVVATADLVIVLGVGVGLFGVPLRGSVAVLAVGALLFLFVTLGTGILVSSVSETQGQAIQLAIMLMLPQVLLSGLIFPLSSIAPGVRWISYVLPLTYFNQISRGVMLRGEPLGALWEPFVLLAVLGAVVGTLAIVRFRRFLAPAGRESEA